MAGGGSSQPSGSTTTTQNSSPWTGQQGYLSGIGGPGGIFDASSANYLPSGAATNNMPIPGTNVTPPAGQYALGALPSAASLYANYAPQYYPGTTYAPETGAQSAAITGQENLGLTGTPDAAASNSAEGNILSSGFLGSNPGNNYYQGVLSGNSPSINAAVANVEPGILDQFTQGGAVSPNSGAGYAVGQGVGNAIAGQMNNAAAGLASNYNTAAGQQNTAAAFGAPAAQAMNYTDLANAYGAGSTQQGLAQNTINDAVTRYNYGQTLPYNLLDQYLGGISGSYGGTSSLTTPYFTQQTGGLGGAASGALSGASAGSVFGPSGAGIGAIAGGLLGGFG